MWPFNFNGKGLYYSDGITWSPLEFDSSALNQITILQDEITQLQGQPPSNAVIQGFPCNQSVSVGDWVYIGVGMAQQAIATDQSTSNVFGVCESKTSNNVCSIRVSGITGTIFSGLDPSKEYFLSDTVPGAMVSSDTIPTATGHVILRLGVPLDANRLVIQKGTLMVRS